MAVGDGFRLPVSWHGVNSGGDPEKKLSKPAARRVLLSGQMYSLQFTTNVVNCNGCGFFVGIQKVRVAKNKKLRRSFFI